MLQPGCFTSVVALSVVSFQLSGQWRASRLIDSARTQLTANHADSAAALLRSALDTSSHATRLNATELVGKARDQLAAGHPDSAQSLLELALDSVLAHPTGRVHRRVAGWTRVLPR